MGALGSLSQEAGVAREGGWGCEVLGRSWVVVSRVISRVTVVITHTRGLRAQIITTHGPPSIDLFITLRAPRSPPSSKEVP